MTQQALNLIALHKPQRTLSSRMDTLEDAAKQQNLEIKDNPEEMQAAGEVHESVRRLILALLYKKFKTLQLDLMFRIAGSSTVLP
ncbi:Hypothetical predicted protein [Pelobates cultripes]|uniref:Uncharacterized protein n=1 Tax=Pelobates cultripes TaxID=61616 RepID=A0AAD1VWW2_PELCU|nr:Hypothetical predicted protein [Pelobates cultripes]